MLKAVARLMTTKRDDAAELQREIAGLKKEGAEASEEIERLKRERALAASFEEAEETDRAIAKQMWITEHAAAALPEFELRLAAVRAADQAAALARHKGILVALYPKLKQALTVAVEAQQAVLEARAAAVAQLGENQVARNLPNLAYAGFLMPDLLAIWQTENDRVFADLARRPKPAAIAPPARAALPAPAKQVVAAAKEAAPRPARKIRLDEFPTEGQQLVVFLRAGSELPDGTVAGIGDKVALPAEQARQVVLQGAAEYVPEKANG